MWALILGALLSLWVASGAEAPPTNTYRALVETVYGPLSGNEEGVAKLADSTQRLRVILAAQPASAARDASLRLCALADRASTLARDLVKRIHSPAQTRVVGNDPRAKADAEKSAAYFSAKWTAEYKTQVTPILTTAAAEWDRIPEDQAFAAPLPGRFGSWEAQVKFLGAKASVTLSAGDRAELSEAQTMLAGLKEKVAPMMVAQHYPDDKIDRCLAAMLHKEVFVGMPASLVRFSWGEPSSISRVEAEGAAYELWNFRAGAKSIRVSNGFVTLISTTAE